MDMTDVKSALVAALLPMATLAAISAGWLAHDALIIRSTPPTIDRVHFYQAGQDALGALDRVGVHCKPEFASDVLVVDWTDGKQGIWGIGSGSAVLSVGGHDCRFRDINISAGNTARSAIKIQEDAK